MSRIKSPLKFRFYFQGTSYSYVGATLEIALEKFKRLHPYGFRQYTGQYIVRDNITGFYKTCESCNTPKSMWVTSTQVRDNKIPSLCRKCK